jgi:hypothetical protein
MKIDGDRLSIRCRHSAFFAAGRSREWVSAHQLFDIGPPERSCCAVLAVLTNKSNPALCGRRQPSTGLGQAEFGGPVDVDGIGRPAAGVGVLCLRPGQRQVVLEHDAPRGGQRPGDHRRCRPGPAPSRRGNVPAMQVADRWHLWDIFRMGPLPRADIGLSIRHIALLIGLGDFATRSRLIQAGVTFRPSQERCPWNRRRYTD